MKSDGDLFVLLCLAVIIGLVVGAMFTSMRSQSNSPIGNSVTIQSNIPVYGYPGGGGSGPGETVGGGNVTFQNMTLQPLISINWGTLTPGSSETVTIFVDNTANRNAQTMNYSLADFVPAEASQFITMTMNSTDLPGNTFVPIDLTIYIAQDTLNVTEVSFNLIIQAGQ